jgi:glyoxylase-like metal-dependent hydrolase (beta-lactamase superfamily II)
MEDRGIFDLNENRAQVRGDVVLRLPDLIFRDHLTLADEGIVFSAAPGHTVDSAICYDQRDKVLYLGDLVEDPIPYLDAVDLNQYLETLQSLWEHEAVTLVSAHSGIISRDLIQKNMGYIRNIRDGSPIDSSLFGEYAPVHQWNLNMRIIHEFLSPTPSPVRYEKSLVPVLAQVGDLHTRTREELLVLLSRISV